MHSLVVPETPDRGCEAVSINCEDTEYGKAHSGSRTCEDCQEEILEKLNLYTVNDIHSEIQEINPDKSQTEITQRGGGIGYL